MNTHLLKWVSTEGRVFILNFDTGRYSVIDGKKAEKWVSVHGPSDTILNLSPTHNFLHSCLKIFLPLWLRCLGVRFYVGFQLKRKGFSYVFSKLKLLRKICYFQSSYEDIVKKFLFIDGLFFFSDNEKDCLVRDLSLFYLLVESDISSELKIAIRPHPFQAHAWVTVNGDVCTEGRERIAGWTVISDVIFKSSK